MNKNVSTFIFFIILFVSLPNFVYGADLDKNQVFDNKIGLQENNSFNNTSIESKSFVINNNSSLDKIHKISVSSSVFKSGSIIRLKVFTDKTIKSVSGHVLEKNRYKLTKTKHGYWYYKFNTKNFKTGVYKLHIKAIDKKNNVYKSSKILTADNVPPKLYSISTSVKTIHAGDQFMVFASADNTSKKIVATIRGKNHGFKYLNDTHWCSKITLSYKEIHTIIILVKAYDSVGNVAKKDTYIVSKPKIVYWNGTLLSKKKSRVSYPKPTNAYEKSIKLLSKYAKVYEGFAVDDFTLGITYKISHGKKVKYNVIIAYKDPFVVYHELGHVLHWNWNEYTCDSFAYNKTGYWVK